MSAEIEVVLSFCYF